MLHLEERLQFCAPQYKDRNLSEVSEGRLTKFENGLQGKARGAAELRAHRHAAQIEARTRERRRAAGGAATCTAPARPPTPAAERTAAAGTDSGRH